MPEPFPVPLDRKAVHVDVQPGGEIILRGSLYSSHDGARIDATTTSWPANAPGGASVDSGGLFDLEAGGFHVTSQNPSTHEVHAIATGDDAPLCALHDVAAPCLPLRLGVQAQSRLLETRDWHASLRGTIAIEVVDAPLYAPAAHWTSQAAPVLKTAGVGLLLALVAAGVAALLYRRSSTPAARLAALARRVRAKAQRAAPVLAAPLNPALDSALQALRAQRVDPLSPHGQKMANVLLRLESTLDEAELSTRRATEQQLADELARDVEIALEAAAEAVHAR
ncbi:MAG: hypothetical protein HY898_06345 [Deltaproteobacteria bacterium]|nr:hypothetical protein [Deltaproteobacteria bacterium]